jgi:hypothetical protein
MNPKLEEEEQLLRHRYPREASQYGEDCMYVDYPTKQRQDSNERERYTIAQCIGACTAEAGWKHGMAS